jgi:hypothetical protein
VKDCAEEAAGLASHSKGGATENFDTTQQNEEVRGTNYYSFWYFMALLIVFL